MCILLDEQLPRQLARQLVGHEVRSVQQQFQQNLSAPPLGVVVLVARSNALEDLLPLVLPLLQAVQDARPGEVRRVATN